MGESIPRAWLDERWTIEDIERWSVGLLDRAVAEGALPAGTRLVPFGENNAQWEEFKARLLPSDEVYFFSAPPELWQKGQGVLGYAAYRNGELVASFLTDTTNWFANRGLPN